MKKKTFIVQLLDSKNPSRMSFTQVEDANFYSNDTDASLVFIPHEDTFNFETAKVVMYNRGDESLVERDAIVTTENGRKVASYELPAEIIAHWGDWTAQPVFTSGGEIYSGSIVPFSVIRYLMHERPATLTEIVTVTEFIQQSQALVDDMEQAEAKRVSAESSRISAETQRVSAESSRVSAEEQRKIDHANRSAELDGKADKVVLKNSTENGDFSDGTNRWRSNAGEASIVEGNYVMTSTGTSVAPNVQSIFTLETKAEEKWYTRAIVRPLDVTNRIQLYTVQSSATPVMIVDAVPTPNVNTWLTLSGVWGVPINMTAHYMFISYSFSTAQESLGKRLEIDNVMAINLTETFGAGNEPTKEEMDELIEITGYIDGEYALNNKEMLGHLMKGIREKANKEQEDWITPTLLNGWTTVPNYSEPCYMKDELGFVHVKGTIKDGSGIALRLPIGYRPAKAVYFPTVDLTSFGTVALDHVGSIIPYAPTRTRVAIHMTFKAEG